MEEHYKSSSIIFRIFPGNVWTIFTDRLCCLKVRSCDVQVDEGVALFDELASYRIGSLFGDVIIGRSDDSLLGFEAGGFQVFPDFLFDLRREIFLEKERVFMPSSVIR